MTLPPPARKALLVTHVSATVGWLGAVLTFAALGVIALTSNDVPTVRGVFLVMEPAASYTLVPLAVVSLVTGLIQSLATPWGLFRHYWVIFKLLITLVATTLLLAYMSTFSHMASVAAQTSPTTTADALRAEAGSPLLHAVLAFVGLLLAMILAVYKPRGVTPYGGQRRARSRRPSRQAPAE
jgi:uncharacterized membrane protein